MRIETTHLSPDSRLPDDIKLGDVFTGRVTITVTGLRHDRIDVGRGETLPGEAFAEVDISYTIEPA